MANDTNKPTRITEYEANVANETVDDGPWVLFSAVTEMAEALQAVFGGNNGK